MVTLARDLCPLIRRTKPRLLKRIQPDRVRFVALEAGAHGYRHLTLDYTFWRISTPLLQTHWFCCTGRSWLHQHDIFGNSSQCMTQDLKTNHHPREHIEEV